MNYIFKKPITDILVTPLIFYAKSWNLCSSPGYGVYVEKLALNYSLKLLMDTEKVEGYSKGVQVVGGHICAKPRV